MYFMNSLYLEDGEGECGMDISQHPDYSQQFSATDEVDRLPIAYLKATPIKQAMKLYCDCGNKLTDPVEIEYGVCDRCM